MNESEREHTFVALFRSGEETSGYGCPQSLSTFPAGLFVFNEDIGEKSRKIVTYRLFWGL